MANNYKKLYPWVKYGYNIKAVPGDSYPVAAYRVTNPDNPEQTVVIAHNTDVSSSHSIHLPDQKYIHGFSVWGQQPSETVDNWILLPPYSTAVVREFAVTE
jgi:hypothetical protein